MIGRSGKAGALLFVLAAQPTLLAAQGRVANPHVTISLIPATTRAAPGEPLRVAVQFAVEEGWHIYWKNPGEGGIVPRMTWTLPTGWTADTLAWPVPERYEVAGLISHIHRGRLAVGTSLRVPASATGRATVKVEMIYGICRDLCMPGKATVQLQIPVGPGQAASPAWGAVQAVLDGRAPRTDPPPTTARLVDSTVTLTIRPRPGLAASPTSWTFFPADRPVSPVAVSGRAGPGSREVTLQIRLADCTPTRLNGILVPGNAALASPTGYAVSVPVRGGGTC